MRLKPEKVEYLATRIAKELQSLQTVTFLATPEQVAGAIRRVILHDLQREDEIEREAEQILQQYRQKINMRNLSYNTLLAKTKQELARKRHIIL